MRLLATSLTREAVAPRLRELIQQLFRDIPCGIGREGAVPVDSAGLDSLLTRGAEWVVERGYGEPPDLEYSEERGRMRGADPSRVSQRADTAPKREKILCRVEFY